MPGPRSAATAELRQQTGELNVSSCCSASWKPRALIRRSTFSSLPSPIVSSVAPADGHRSFAAQQPAVLLNALVDHQVVFFGGKGGVGKTTCSSAFALAASSRGKRVLLVSTDPAHSTSDIFQKKIGTSERELQRGLTALEIDGEEEAARYIADVKADIRKMFSPGVISQANRQIEMAAASPGLIEVALLDKMIDLLLRSGAIDRLRRRRPATRCSCCGCPRLAWIRARTGTGGAAKSIGAARAVARAEAAAVGARGSRAPRAVTGCRCAVGARHSSWWRFPNGWSSRRPRARPSSSPTPGSRWAG